MKYIVRQIRNTAEASEKMLNDLSEDGWEVITVYNNHFLLKSSVGKVNIKKQ